MELVSGTSLFSFLFFGFAIRGLQGAPHGAYSGRYTEPEANDRQPVTRSELSIQKTASEETDEDAES
jgi:hypothetical protein